MKMILSSTLAAVVLSLPASLSAAEGRPSYAPLNYYMHKALTDVCISIAKNRPGRMIRTMRSYRLDYKLVGQKLVCNDLPAIAFADHTGADRNAALLRRKVGEHTLDELVMNWGEPFKIYLDDLPR